jgi:hypothetical protein
MTDQRYPTPEAAEQAAREAVVKSDDYIPFVGQNCDDDCSGWDGESYRCACHNRRVYWAISGDATNGFYAEAYAN